MKSYRYVRNLVHRLRRGHWPRWYHENGSVRFVCGAKGWGLNTRCKGVRKWV